MACGSWLMNLDFAGGEIGAPAVTAKYKGFIGTNVGRLGRLGAIVLPFIFSLLYSLPID